MTKQQIAAIEQCDAQAMTGEISFGEVVKRLSAIGIERYHADYSRLEKTYYLADGQSHVTPIEMKAMPVASAFSAAAVEASVRQSQRGEIQYPRFVEQTMAAGCVGYFVQMTGKCVQYFGREGETHTEWFPGAAKK